MAAKKKYYAIAKGHEPGIYDNWPEAQAQIDGYKGAAYKGFSTREEAEEWLENPSLDRPAKTGTATGTAPAKQGDLPKPGEITIYTDGGAINNPGPGGYGIVMLFNGHRKELSGGFAHTTNNRMELMACIVALRELKRQDIPVTLYSDSSYVVNGITKGWAKSWRRNNWIKSNKESALNPDLWAELLNLTEGLKITFKWVKGHAGHPMNERCDELAVQSAKKKGLPVDTGYKNNGNF